MNCEVRIVFIPPEIAMPGDADTISVVAVEPGDLFVEFPDLDGQSVDVGLIDCNARHQNHSDPLSRAVSTVLPEEFMT